MNFLKMLKEKYLKKLPSMQRVKVPGKVYNALAVTLPFECSRIMISAYTINSGNMISRKQLTQKKSEKCSLGFIQTVH